MKEIDNFITLIVNLEPIEFMGLAKVLNVNIYKDEKQSEPREFEEVFEEVLEKFDKCNRARKREILKLLKAARGKKKNAGNS